MKNFLLNNCAYSFLKVFGFSFLFANNEMLQYIFQFFYTIIFGEFVAI